MKKLLMITALLLSFMSLTSCRKVELREGENVRYSVSIGTSASNSLYAGNSDGKVVLENSSGQRFDAETTELQVSGYIKYLGRGYGGTITERTYDVSKAIMTDSDADFNAYYQFITANGETITEITEINILIKTGLIPSTGKTYSREFKQTNESVWDYSLGLAYMFYDLGINIVDTLDARSNGQYSSKFTVVDFSDSFVLYEQ